MNAIIEMARKISGRLKPSRVWEPMRRTGEEYPADPTAVIYGNNIYSATLRHHGEGWPLGGGPWAMIGIWCEDGEARHDWRDFQEIKNDLVGSNWEAVELYPSEARLLDPSNYYMLYCAPSIPVGKFEGRRLAGPADCIAPQRGWSRGTPPATILPAAGFKSASPAAFFYARSPTTRAAGACLGTGRRQLSRPERGGGRHE